MLSIIEPFARIFGAISPLAHSKARSFVVLPLAFVGLDHVAVDSFFLQSKCLVLILAAVFSSTSTPSLTATTARSVPPRRCRSDSSSEVTLVVLPLDRRLPAIDESPIDLMT